MLQALHQDIGPSLAQDIQHLTPLDIFVRDHHHCRVITTDHHITPSPSATRHPVSNVAQPTPQSPYSLGQTSRQVQRENGYAPGGCFCRPVAHAIPPGTNHRSSAPNTTSRSADVQPTTSAVPQQTCCRAVFETFRKIEVTDRAQGCDHVILCGECPRHLPIRVHSGIYVAPTSEPGFFTDHGVDPGDGGVEQVGNRGAGTLEPRRPTICRSSKFFRIP